MTFQHSNLDFVSILRKLKTKIVKQEKPVHVRTNFTILLNIQEHSIELKQTSCVLQKGKQTYHYQNYLLVDRQPKLIHN